MRIPSLDPRLLIGVGLVIVAVIGVVGVVLAANRTVSVYAAAAPIAAGAPVDPGAFDVVEVHVATPSGLYLAPGDATDDLVITRPIGPGEFIPLSALGTEDAGMSAVVVPITGAVPASVATGSDVTLWAAQPGEKSGTFAASAVLVESAHVVALIAEERMIGSGSVQLELRVPAAQVAAVLDAIANGAQLQVVPIHTPLVTGQGN